MSPSLIVVIGLILVIFFARSAAVRRRRLMNRLGAQVTRSIRPASDDALAGIGALGDNIAQAVRQALAERGLPTGNISVTSSVSSGAGGDALAGGAAGAPNAANLGVGDVLSVSSLTGAPVATVELDAIGAPKRRVTINLPSGTRISRGDRIYVRLDPNDPAGAALVEGLAPPATANRLDPLVLQPMLLARGEQGKGVVRTAEVMALPPGAASLGGASSWRLDLEITPRSGFPYRAEIVTALSTPEKAARICHPGAEVAVRYDPADPKTVMVDVVAMGFAAPSHGGMAIDTSGFASMGPIERIKALREQTGLGLKDAKDLMERMAADPAGFAQAAQPARPDQAAQASIDWASLAGLGKIEKIAVIRERTGLGLAQAKALVDAMDGAGLSATDRMTAMLSGRP